MLKKSMLPWLLCLVLVTVLVMAADLKEKTGATLLSSTAAWDSQGGAGTETALYTVPTGKTCVVTHVVIHTASASMATSVVTLGIAGGSTDEFRGDVTLTNVDGTTKYAIIHQQASTRDTPDGGVLITAAAVFAIEVTTADADGGTATVDVFGYIF